MTIKEFYKSKIFSRVIVMVGIACATVFVFGFGVMVGYHKASFSYRWGENYHRNFGGPRGGFTAPFSRDDFSNSHGAFGKIIKIELPTFIMQSQGELEKVVRVGTSTTFRRFRDEVSVTNIALNDYVVIIGEPNSSGEIEAKFVRLLPPPPDFVMSKSKKR